MPTVKYKIVFLEIRISHVHIEKYINVKKKDILIHQFNSQIRINDAQYSTTGYESYD